MKYNSVLEYLILRRPIPFKWKAPAVLIDVKGAHSEDGDNEQAQRIGTSTRATHSRGCKSKRVGGTTDERENHKKSSRTAFSKRAERQSDGAATRLAERRNASG